MAKTDQRFYIRIPVTLQGKTTYEYLPIDPALLHIGILTTLYNKKAPNCQSKGGDDYLPAYGAEALVNLRLDPADIVFELREKETEVYDTLEAVGPEGERCRDLVRDLKLDQLIEAVASCDLERGKEAVRHVMYTLMGSLSDMAAELQERQNSVRHLDATVKDCLTVLNEDERVEDANLRWSCAVTSLIRSAHSLLGVERSIETFLVRVKSTYAIWQNLLNEEKDAFRESMTFFEPEDGSGGFIVRALLYQSGEGTRSDMKALIAEAKERIQKCRAIETQVESQYNSFKTEYHRDLIGTEGSAYRESAETCLKDLAEAQNTLLSCEEAYETYPKPYNAKEALVTKEQYDEAMRYLPPKDDRIVHPWRIGTRRMQVRFAVSRCGELLSKPLRLSERLRNMLAEAERIIKEIEEDKLLDRPTVVPAPAEPEPTPIPGPPALPTGCAEPGPAAEPQCRLDELYELALCVGYATTLTARSLSLTTRTVMKIIVALDMSDDIEFSEIGRKFSERIMQNSERVGSWEAAPRRRLESMKDWILFPMDDGVSRKKLTSRASERVPSLIRKHGLTEEVIERTAFRIRE